MHIAETHSTSSLIREQYFDCENGFYIRADYQSAGRGQTGNSWFSLKGQNLLFSILLRDCDIAAGEAFLINMAVSLAIRNTLVTMSPECKASIKWPNDIYIGDRKVCGILVENYLEGATISRSIVGIGLNVHQTEWPEVLPNPISLYEATGNTYDIDALCAEIVAEIKRQMARLGRGENLKSEYMAALYRREGWWPYAEREVNTIPTAIRRDSEAAFEAQTADITTQGELVLERRDGSRKNYHFKQIQFIIPQS